MICGPFCCVPCFAQSPEEAKPCSEPPIQEDRAPRKVVIDRIEFDGPIHLGEADVAQIISDTNRHELDADNSGWVDELTEIGLREAWQDQGYFQLKVTAQARSLGGDNSGEEHFVVKAHVDEGLQYHLGDLRFANAQPDDALAFSENELRNAFPLRDGELFSVALIRRGIENLTKLYGSQGYIDFTAVPETAVDQQLQRISLVMRLDQQKQFRIRTVDVVGVDPGLKALLTSKLKPGEIFNPNAIRDFFAENRTVLPPLLEGRGFRVRRNVRDGTVDLFFNFLPVGVVEGVVLDSSGQPVADALVYYQVDDDASTSHQSTTTDCSGHFVLESVLAGDVQVRASKESDGYTDRTFDSPFYADLSGGEFPELKVRAGETVKDAVVRLGRQGAALELNVFDADTKGPFDGGDYKLCRGGDARGDPACLSGSFWGRPVHRIVPPVPITVEIKALGYDSWNYRDDNSGSALLELHPGEVKPLTIYVKRSGKKTK